MDVLSAEASEKENNLQGSRSRPTVPADKVEGHSKQKSSKHLMPYVVLELSWSKGQNDPIGPAQHIIIEWNETRSCSMQCALSQRDI